MIWPLKMALILSFYPILLESHYKNVRHKKAPTKLYKIWFNIIRSSVQVSNIKHNYVLF